MGGGERLGLSRKARLAVLALLLASDALMLALHISHLRTIHGAPTLLVLRDPAFSLARDGGGAETLEYLKYVVLTLNCALAIAVAAAARVRIWPPDPAGYASGER